ncbi:MAG TPA: LuxR C-terminal-related transcriptional regulator [Allosphingosinicella sp.]|jgi:DNA-binding CsgD family transcriptional regulator
MIVVTPRKLTRAQRQLVELAAAGYRQEEIAARLNIRRNAVESSFSRMRARLDARSTLHVVAIALTHGLIDQKEVARLPLPPSRQPKGGRRKK